MSVLLMLGVPAGASHPEVSLPGRDFEIGTNANLKVDIPLHPWTGPISDCHRGPPRPIPKGSPGAHA